MRLAPFGAAGTAHRVHQFPCLVGKDVRKCRRGDVFDPAAVSSYGEVSAQQTHTLEPATLLCRPVEPFAAVGGVGRLTDADKHVPDTGDRRDLATGEFRRALAESGQGAVLVLGHNDADGLAASSILARGLARQGRPTEVRILQRGETAWSPDIRAELAGRAPGGLIVTDFGVRSGTILPSVPTVFIDHHVPQGSPESATVLSGFGMDPVPTSSLLAFRCVSAGANVDDLLWLAAVGLVGDMAETSGFVEMAVAHRRWGITLLRRIASLLNQPRRSASGDPTPAWPCS